MKVIVSILILFCAKVNFAQELNLFFNTGSSILDTNEMVKLDRWIKQHKNAQAITVVGYTDSIGTLSYNLKLSERRIKTVSAYLVKKGVLVKSIQSLPKGESTYASDLAYNRRVSLFIAKDFSQVRNIEQMKQLVQPNKQSFTINAFRDTILTAEKGTKIYIPAFAFRDHQNKLVKDVKITLQEFYNTVDFFSSNLTTITTDRQIIETQGMVKLNAIGTKKAGQLVLRDSISLFFPAQNSNNDFQTFYGSQDAERNINWEPETTLKLEDIIDCKINLEPNWTDFSLNVTYKNQKNEIVNKVLKDKFENKIDYVQLRKIDLKQLVNKYLVVEPSPSRRTVKNVSYQMIQTNRLGYINCDRFVNKEKAPFKLNINVDEEFVNFSESMYDINTQYITAMVVFKDVKAILPVCFKLKSLTINSDYPKNFEADLIVLYQKDGRLLIYKLKDIQDLNNQVMDAQFEASSYSELNKMLALY